MRLTLGGFTQRGAQRREGLNAERAHAKMQRCKGKDGITRLRFSLASNLSSLREPHLPVALFLHSKAKPPGPLLIRAAGFLDWGARRGACAEGLHHAAHAAAVVVTVAGVALFLFRQLSDEALGGEEQTADGGCVLQGAAGDLGRVDNTAGDEVFHFA